MEYSSSEDDELIEDYVDLEDDIATSDADQQQNDVAMPLHFLEHGENSVIVVDHSIGNDLLSADGMAKSQEPFLGMEFESDAAARSFYNAYAARLGFGIRVARSRTERRKGVEILVMKRFVCLKEGHHKKKATDGTVKKKRKRLSIRDGCPAMMEVVRRGPDVWLVTKLILEHTHVVVSPDRIREIQLNRLSGKDREHEDYLKEMRQKIFGEGDAQGLLEYFKKTQAANSSFFYAMQVDSRNCMTNIFWADFKARMAYNYFGDAVTFDTSYKKNKLMPPFAAFTGMNHHGQSVSFGCALVVDRTEASFLWLFETWLSAMYGRHPISLTTDQGSAIGAAVAKVFPNTRHRLCKWRILSRCKSKLSDGYSRYPTLHEELQNCVIKCASAEAFEACWKLILDRYDLRENIWLQSLYQVRHKWIPAYTKDSFFAELSTSQRSQSMNGFFRKHFNTKATLLAFIKKFDEVMDARHENEAQEDLSSVHSLQTLKTNSPMEKQAAEIYTRTIFEIFQMELVEGLSHYAVKIQDGPISKYAVDRDGDGRNRHLVALNASEKKAVCSCFMFEVSGVLCRHVLGLFCLTGLNLLPEHYILKRWTRKAKAGLILDERDVEAQSYFQNPNLRYDDLLRDAIKLAEKGAASAETYRVAKEMLRKAFAEIVCLEESMRKQGQHRGGNM